MPIGTSDGETFKDKFEYALSSLSSTGIEGKSKFFLQPSFGKYDDTPTIHSQADVTEIEKPTVDYLKSIEKGMEMQQVQTDTFRNEDKLDKADSQKIADKNFSWEKQTTIPDVKDSNDTIGWEQMFERGSKTDKEILKNLPENYEAFKETMPGGKSWTGKEYPAKDYIWIRKKPKEIPKLEDLVS